MDQNLPNLGTGQQQPGLPGSDAIFGIQPTSADQTLEVGGQPTKDSIEKAAAIVAALYMPPMSNPLLVPPDPNVTVAIGQLAMDKICLNILDSWSKNLQEIAEQAKEAQKKRNSIQYGENFM